MTYQNLKTKVVEEQREMTPKVFRRFMLRYALMLLTLAFEFMLVVSSIVNYYVALVTGIIFILAFIVICLISTHTKMVQLTEHISILTMRWVKPSVPS